MLRKIKKEWIIVLLIVFFSFALRIYKINTDLLFHRDQGMVAMDIYKIWHDKKISLIGAPTDVDGLYHSPVYYWILTPLYWLGNGNIIYPAVFQIFLEVISLPFLYLAVKKLFDKKTALLTLIIYSVSYGLISYSRWFITVPFILPLANLLLYFLASGTNIFAVSLLVGMITQTNAAVGVFYLPFVFYHFRKYLTFQNLFIIFTGFIIPAIPLIIFQFRHDFIILKTVASYSSGSAGLGVSLQVFFGNLIKFLQEANHLILFPFIVPSTLLLWYGLWKAGKSKKLLLSYLAIPFIFLAFYKRGSISFFYMAALPAILAVLANGILKLPKTLSYFLVGFVVVYNIVLLKNVYEPNNALIPIGDRNIITISDRKKILDWMYTKADGKKFSTWIYTIPYFQDYPWDYLLTTYALPKYGYLPEKTGSFSPGDLKNSEIFFDVYEVDHDNPSRQSVWFYDINKSFGNTLDYFGSHDIHVELRSWDPKKQ